MPFIKNKTKVLCITNVFLLFLIFYNLALKSDPRETQTFEGYINISIKA